MPKPDPITLRIDEHHAQILAPRHGTLRDRSETIRTILERYAEVCRRSVPDLSVPELCLICDALNGCWMSGASAASGVPLEVHDAIRLNRDDEKWSVDGERLIARLAAAPYAELLALVDLAERFWAEDAPPGEDYAATFARLLGRPV